jgi:hypothetical protein
MAISCCIKNPDSLSFWFTDVKLLAIAGWHFLSEFKKTLITAGWNQTVFGGYSYSTIFIIEVTAIIKPAFADKGVKLAVAPG